MMPLRFIIWCGGGGFGGCGGLVFLIFPLSLALSPQAPAHELRVKPQLPHWEVSACALLGGGQIFVRRNCRNLRGSEVLDISGYDYVAPAVFGTRRYDCIFEIGPPQGASPVENHSVYRGHFEVV